MKMGLFKNSTIEEVNIQKEEIEEQEVSRLLYFDRPSLMDRLKSTAIDGVVVILLMLLASQMMTSLQVDSGIVRGIVLAALLLYEPAFTALHKTIGQLIMGLTRIIHGRGLISNFDSRPC